MKNGQKVKLKKFLLVLFYLFLVITLTDGTYSSPKKKGDGEGLKLDLLAAETLEMISHSFNSYMDNAFPADELNPIRCTGRSKDRNNPGNVNLNDVLGDFMLTLIDSLDTLAVVGNYSSFEKSVQIVTSRLQSFDIDSLVSVFEVTIRVLGGLLSAHLVIVQPELGFRENLSQEFLHSYKDDLLLLAYDLGLRLLPAFEGTATKIPYPRVNLRYGIPPEWKTDYRGQARANTTDENGQYQEKETFQHAKWVYGETCSAGAGTLVLEFGLLGKLVGDSRFEEVTKGAMEGIWQRRSSKNLIGNVIDIQTGSWVHTESGIGAGIDSFFEYALKAHILFGDDDYLNLFTTAYTAIQQHVKDPVTNLYRNVQMTTASPYSTWIDSLSAYFPGLQVLHGDIEGAIISHEIYNTLWKKYNSLPERYDFQRKAVNVPWYPLRPEFIESTYFLYQATKDPYYLEIGARVLKDLQTYARLNCGFATIHNVLAKTHEDRMESFFIAETLKYLYLLFDVENPLHKVESNFVFSTEGHILMIPHQLQQFNKLPKKTSSSQKTPVYSCPAYSHSPWFLNKFKVEFEKIHFALGISFRPIQNEMEEVCRIEETPAPVVYQVKVEGIEDPEGVQKELIFHGRDIYVESLTGYHLEVRSFDNEIFRLSKIGDTVIQKGGIVTILEKSFLKPNQESLGHYATVKVVKVGNVESHQEHIFTGRPSVLGGKSSVEMEGHEEGVKGEVFLINHLACGPLIMPESAQVEGKIVVVDRGICLFDTKITNIKAAGAIGVIVVNSDESSFEMVIGPDVHHPSVKSENQEAQQPVKKQTIPAVLIPKSSGDILKKLMTNSSKVILSIQPGIENEEEEITSTSQLVLNFNGKAIENTKIVKVFPKFLQKKEEI